jgi:plasmid stabilization system protein ParE
MTEAASADLAEIRAFIAEDSPPAADRFVHQIVAGLEPHLAAALQEARKSDNIHAGSGVIWGLPDQGGLDIGTIAFEAALQGRKTISSDLSPFRP